MLSKQHGTPTNAAWLVIEEYAHVIHRLSVCQFASSITPENVKI